MTGPDYTVLAIDTATKVSSIAIANETDVLAEQTVLTNFTHSETLVPNIEAVMELTGIERDDLSAVAVSLGPGSFTGLRIGLATAKALSYALSIPLVGVPTLEVLAAALPYPGAIIAPLIDAQKGNAYYALYEYVKTELVCKKDVVVASPKEILASLEEENAPVILTGDFLPKLRKTGLELPENVSFAPITHRLPRASLVAVRAIKRLKKGEGKSPMDLEPIYIRRSEAEVLWEKRHQEVGTIESE